MTAHNHLFSFKCPEMLFQEDSIYDLPWDRSYAESPSVTSRHQWHST